MPEAWKVPIHKTRFSTSTAPINYILRGLECERLSYSRRLNTPMTSKSLISPLSSVMLLNAPEQSMFRIDMIKSRMNDIICMHLTQLAALALLCWFLWRVWLFKISPWIWPRLPKVLPYWIPCRSPVFDWRNLLTLYHHSVLGEHGQVQIKEKLLNKSTRT